MIKYMIGIDPGLDGGIAIMDTETHKIVYADRMPVLIINEKRELDANMIVDIIKQYTMPDNMPIAAIELVHAMPKQGVTSMFTFGKGYGMIIGILSGLGIKAHLVRPKKWKEVVLPNTTKDKTASIEYCWAKFDAKLIPKGCRVPHDGIADAICIAEWLYLTEKTNEVV